MNALLMIFCKLSILRVDINLGFYVKFEKQQLAFFERGDSDFP